MRLETYLKREGIGVGDFAKRVGCSRITIWRLFKGHTVPWGSLAKAILRETNGEVTPNEFYEIPAGQSTNPNQSVCVGCYDRNIPPGV